MIDKQPLQEELERIYGAEARFTEPSLASRLRAAIRRLIHPLGVHDTIQEFRWDARLNRLIDEGMVCRVCGAPRH